MSDSRADFEAWHEDEFDPSNPHTNVVFSLKETRWKAWTAARASQWRDIETAPKDGTHIMACRGPFTSNWTFAQAPAYVCHWWNNPGEEGWYLSSGDSGQISWHPTDWQPLPQPPVSK